SLARGYGVAFEMVDDSAGRPKLTPGIDAVWVVSRCDFVARARVRRTSPGAEAAPELEQEAREASGDAELSPREPGVARAFSFSLKGWVRTPSPDPDEPFRDVSRIAVSGDASYDEALGSDDPEEWFDSVLTRIADAILDRMPRP